MGIAKIDKNFAIQNEKNEGMVEYTIPCPLFDLYGIFYSQKDKRFWRMDKETASKVNGGVDWGNRYTAGGRIRFRTNAKKLELTVKSSSEDGEAASRMTVLAACGFILCEDKNGEEIVVANLVGKGSELTNFHVSVNLMGDWKDFILYFPLYNDVQEVKIALNEEDRKSVV